VKGTIKLFGIEHINDMCVDLKLSATAASLKLKAHRYLAIKDFIICNHLKMLDIFS